MSSGRELVTLEHTHSEKSLTFSPDGSLLVCASGNRTLVTGEKENVVKLWEVPNGPELAILKGNGPCPMTVAFSPDGSLLASGWMKALSSGGMVKLWEMPDRREALTVDGLGDSVADIAFSPDGSLLAVGLYNKSLILLKMPNGQKLTTLKDLEGNSSPVVFSSGGALLAAELTTTLPDWSTEKAFGVWEMSSRRQIVAKHGWEFCNPAFSPDTSLLVTTNRNDIKVWGLSGTGVREISADKQTPWEVPQVEVEKELVIEPQRRPPRKLTRKEVLAIVTKAQAADEPADLAGDDLSGIDLSGANLKKTNLTGANLVGANLTNVNLDFAKLNNADLAGANLTDSKLSAHLEGANLSQATLSGATLDFAQLQGANLSGVLLDNEAALRSADLTGANLTKAVLLSTHIQRANLTDVDLTGTDLTGAQLEDTIVPNGQTYNVGMSLAQFGATRHDIF